MANKSICALVAKLQYDARNCALFYYDCRSSQCDKKPPKFVCFEFIFPWYIGTWWDRLVEYGDDEEFNLNIQDHLMVHTRT